VANKAASGEGRPGHSNEHSPSPPTRGRLTRIVQVHHGDTENTEKTNSVSTCDWRSLAPASHAHFADNSFSCLPFSVSSVPPWSMHFFSDLFFAPLALLCGPSLLKPRRVLDLRLAAKFRNFRETIPPVERILTLCERGKWRVPSGEWRWGDGEMGRARGVYPQGGNGVGRRLSGLAPMRRACDGACDAGGLVAWRDWSGGIASGWTINDCSSCACDPMQRMRRFAEGEAEGRECLGRDFGRARSTSSELAGTSSTPVEHPDRQMSRAGQIVAVR
jgi:hypothetical protein